MAVRVLLDARKVGDGGIGSYLENLLVGLSELRSNGRIRLEAVLLLPPLKSYAPRTDLAATIEQWRSEWECLIEPAGKYSAAEYLSLARRHKSLLQTVDLYHSPHYTLPFFLGVPTVVTVHDVIHLQFPRHRLIRPSARILIETALRRADAVVTVSKHSRSQLIGHFPSSQTPVFVVPNAVAPGYRLNASRNDAQLLDALNVDKPFVLYVGSDRPHKGFDILCDAWNRAAALEGSAVADAELLIVGEQFSDTARQMAKEKCRTVRFLGSLPTENLSALYRAARAVVLSSREEGFGLPALEAMASGSAVVSTPLPSVREICGEAAFFSTTFDGPSLSKALLAGLQVGRLHESKIRLGLRRAQQFSCAAQAEETCAVYEAVLCARGSAGRDIWGEPQRSTMSFRAFGGI